MMTLSLNNQPRNFDENITLSAFLEQYPPTGSFAVALNGEFVPRSCYGEKILADGDQVDIVAPVGGG